MKFKIITLLILVSSHLAAQETVGSDSIITANTTPRSDINTKFRTTQLILPASLIAVGAWGTYNGWMQTVHHSIRNEMTQLRGDNYIKVDDYVQYLPIASYLGLGAIGAKSKHSFKERFVVAATSYIAVGIMVNTVKYTAKIERPNGIEFNSFPSGHTSTTFMGAELVRMEYGVGYGIGAYTVACGVAFLRLYNNKHWLSDVVAGAGFGILSARIGYWLLPLNRKIFGWDKDSRSTIALLPTYDPTHRAFGIGLAAQF